MGVDKRGGGGGGGVSVKFIALNFVSQQAYYYASYYI